jgi:hypothetical protein
MAWRRGFRHGWARVARDLARARVCNESSAVIDRSSREVENVGESQLASGQAEWQSLVRVRSKFEVVASAVRRGHTSTRFDNSGGVSVEGYGRKAGSIVFVTMLQRCAGVEVGGRWFRHILKSLRAESHR